MAYKFHYCEVPGETLDHEPEFKKSIDDLVRQAKTVVCVGWRPDTGYHLFRNMIEDEKEIYLIEAFPANANQFEYYGVEVINGDVREYQDLLPYLGMDLLIWQDGPEHLPIQESKKLLEQMKEHFKSMIISTPKGYYAQDALYGNKWEKHLSAWEQSDYSEIGFKSSLFCGYKFIVGYWQNV